MSSTAPKPQQMQSRKESPNASTLRRPRGNSGSDRDQRQLHSRFAHAHTVSGEDAHALRYTLAVDERAERAVVHEYEMLAVVQESAMPARDASETFGQRDRCLALSAATDDERTLIECESVPFVENV